MWTLNDAIKEAINASCYSQSAALKKHDIRYDTFNRWMNGKSEPRKSSMEKIERLITDMNNHPRMTRHPSYGYATPEQIERLQTIGMCPERDQIMKAIEKQNAYGGKTKF